MKHYCGGREADGGGDKLLRRQRRQRQGVQWRQERRRREREEFVLMNGWFHIARKRGKPIASGMDVVCHCKSRNRCEALDFLIVWLRCLGWDSLGLLIVYIIYIVVICCLLQSDKNNGFACCQ
jgi:hypothetical protein